MIVKVKPKLLIVIFSLMTVMGLIYLETEVLFPRDSWTTVSVEGSPRSRKLIKNNKATITILAFLNMTMKIQIL